MRIFTTNSYNKLIFTKFPGKPSLTEIHKHMRTITEHIPRKVF